MKAKEERININITLTGGYDSLRVAFEQIKRDYRASRKTNKANGKNYSYESMMYYEDEVIEGTEIEGFSPDFRIEEQNGKKVLIIQSKMNYDK